MEGNQEIQHYEQKGLKSYEHLHIKLYPESEVQHMCASVVRSNQPTPIIVNLQKQIGIMKKLQMKISNSI